MRLALEELGKWLVSSHARRNHWSYYALSGWKREVVSERQWYRAVAWSVTDRPLRPKGAIR